MSLHLHAPEDPQRSAVEAVKAAASRLVNLVGNIFAKLSGRKGQSRQNNTEKASLSAKISQSASHSSLSTPSKPLEHPHLEDLNRARQAIRQGESPQVVIQRLSQSKTVIGKSPEVAQNYAETILRSATYRESNQTQGLTQQRSQARTQKVSLHR